MVTLHVFFNSEVPSANLNFAMTISKLVEVISVVSKLSDHYQTVTIYSHHNCLANSISLVEITPSLSEFQNIK